MSLYVGCKVICDIQCTAPKSTMWIHMQILLALDRCVCMCACVHNKRDLGVDTSSRLPG